MMTVFAKKAERAKALGSAYEAVRSRIEYEQQWNYRKAKDGEELEEWELANNERLDYHIEVLEEVCKVLEKML